MINYSGLSLGKGLFNLSILNLPATVFPQLTSKAISLILIFVQKGGVGISTPAFRETGKRINGGVFSYQQLLVPYIFNDDAEIRFKSINILLIGCLNFPKGLVDANPTGPLYTIMYSLTWIFVTAEIGDADVSPVNVPLMIVDYNSEVVFGRFGDSTEFT